MKKLLIWGASDQGVVTLDIALSMDCYDVIDFLAFKEKKHRKILGYKIYRESEVDLKLFLSNYDEIIVATGNNNLREVKVNILDYLGYPLSSIIHPSAIISSSASIKKGCIIGANAVINAFAKVGKGCIINTGVIVEHDCKIEDYVNISPNTAMAGHTRIGRKTFIGIGATIINNISIGCDVVVGAGSVVIKDVMERTLVVGVPAKVIQ